MKIVKLRVKTWLCSSRTQKVREAQCQSLMQPICSILSATRQRAWNERVCVATPTFTCLVGAKASGKSTGVIGLYRQATREINMVRHTSLHDHGLAATRRQTRCSNKFLPSLAALSCTPRLNIFSFRTCDRCIKELPS